MILTEDDVDQYVILGAGLDTWTGDRLQAEGV